MISGNAPENEDDEAAEKITEKPAVLVEIREFRPPA